MPHPPHILMKADMLHKHGSHNYLDGRVIALGHFNSSGSDV